MLITHLMNSVQYFNVKVCITITDLAAVVFARYVNESCKKERSYFYITTTLKHYILYMQYKGTGCV